MSFPGNVAIVTGGSRGIGRAIVLELIASDVKVAFTYHNNRQAAETICKKRKTRWRDCGSSRCSRLRRRQGHLHRS
jgi:3-oxoacyl-[acyl-carrier protein] reductase